MENNNMENGTVDTANESKSEKFIRLAEGRMTKVRVALSILDNLANRSAYDYTEEQVNLMFGILEKEVAEVKAHFLKTEKGDKKFTFGKVEE